MFEPQLSGSGRGESNLIVQKSSKPWTWRAGIGWYKIAGQEDSHLYFASGDKKLTRLPGKAGVTVKLSRQGNKYLAQYKIPKLGWEKLGEFEAETNESLYAVLVNHQPFSPVPQLTSFYADFSLRIEK